MKYTLRHYYAFEGNTGPSGDSLLSPDAWDRVRTSGLGASNEAFYLPSERDAWVRLCEASTLAHQCAASIAALVSCDQQTSILSVGVGRACVEYHLKLFLPSVELHCTEFSPAVVERLKRVFVECNRIDLLDLMSSWPQVGEHCLVLLNRVDTELADEQWKTVFQRMALAGVQNVLVVATGFLTPRSLAWEFAMRILCIARRRPLTFAGYIRSKSRFRELWQPGYVEQRECAIGPLTGFFLRRP